MSEVTAREYVGEVTAREYVGEVHISGKGQQIGFNARYLVDALRIFGGADSIELAIVDGSTPMVIRAGAVEPFAIVMPARAVDEKLVAETLSQWAKAHQVGRAA